jgi:hypothetical protein
MYETVKHEASCRSDEMGTRGCFSVHECALPGAGDAPGSQRGRWQSGSEHRIRGPIPAMPGKDLLEDMRRMAAEAGGLFEVSAQLRAVIRGGRSAR